MSSTSKHIVESFLFFLYGLAIWSHIVSSSKQVELKTDLYLLFIISDSHVVVCVGGGGILLTKQPSQATSLNKPHIIDEQLSI